jgi:type I restriction enzyme, S subunit
MAGEWETARLSQLCEQIADCPHSTPLWTDSGVIVLRNQNIRDGRLDLSSPSYTDEAHFEQRSRRARLKSGDLVLTREAPMGEVCMIPENLRCCLGQRMVMLRPDPKKCDSRFLLYSIQSDTVQHEIKVNEGTGSTVSNLRIPLLEALPIPFPPLAEQKAIAAVLGALDDKIELNRRMNAKLEAMARALFQSWFVDFDPVRAKLDGRQPIGLDPDTAALFPSSFQESLLGLIPHGWKADTLKNRASRIQYGFTQRATEKPIGPHFLRITDIGGGRLDWTSVPFCQATDEELEKYRIIDGDIFIARTGASTGESFYAVEPPQAVFASYLIRLQFPSRGIGRLVGEFARTPDYASYVAGIIGGSAQPNASAQALAGATMAFPTEAIADAFYRTVRPLDLMRAANDRESHALTTLRETLLPKLLSGELTILTK